VKYFQLRLDQTILHGSCRLLQAIRSEVRTVDDQLKVLSHELNVLVHEFVDSPADDSIHTDPIYTADDTSSDTLDDLYVSVAEALHRRIPKLAAELDEQLSGEFFAKHGGLRGVLENEVDLRGPFSAILRGSARTAVFRALNQMNVAELLLSSGTWSPQSSRAVRALLEAATPPLLQSGGAKRLLLVCPEGSDDASLQEAFVHHVEETPSVVHDSDGDMVLCYEAEQLPLATVAASLICNRSDYAQAATRLHTRIDVQWTPLLPLDVG